MESTEIVSCKLTEFSHGSGCGCKIAPEVLEQILNSTGTTLKDPNLLVGNETKDDAAVYDLGNGQALISTTDFFMPIVDDPFDFGRIAATNAISDIYAMGGTPVMAIAILGWPVNKISPEIASIVIKGAKEVCMAAGIQIAGGHSIDNPEPVFGLAVNGLVEIKNLKKNQGAKEGDYLFLTKPLGTGILGTALKRSVLKEEDYLKLIEVTTSLNKAGVELGKIKGINALTDITGFGFLGHLLEVLESSDVSAEIDFSKLPLINGLEFYINQFCYPDNTTRNWSSFASKVSGAEGLSFISLSDPQTSGGLLVSVEEAYVEEYLKVVSDFDFFKCASIPVGRIMSIENTRIRIVNS